jgi:hypothetical protein
MMGLVDRHGGEDEDSLSLGLPFYPLLRTKEGILPLDVLSDHESHSLSAIGSYLCCINHAILTIEPFLLLVPILVMSRSHSCI